MAATPSVIGRYQIRSRLGEGGMGVVYLAHDPAMDSDIAIKLLRSPMADDALRKRFAREAMMARRVGVHPNVVTIFDIGEHEGDPFIAMEYVSGETLEHMIRRQALPKATRRLQIVEDLCTGLSHAHRAGLVHRDIKPANVMLTDDGTVKILDFGVARAAESDLTADGMVIGALNYMSPEQMTGSALDARSDVFAVGALFYELLSGRRAFPGSIREGLPYRIIHGMPPPLSEVVADVDPEIERIILRALEKDPAKRYQDVGGMRQDIARVRRRLEHAQIEAALGHAREAFDTGDYEAVVASCVEVTSIDPDEPRALDLLQRTEEARTGESEATVLSSERPTVALQVPGPPPSPRVATSPPIPAPRVPTGSAAASSVSTPRVPTGSAAASSISASTPVPPVMPPPGSDSGVPAPMRRQGASPLLLVGGAVLLLAAVVSIAAGAWMIGRSGARPPAATASLERVSPPQQSSPPQRSAQAPSGAQQAPPQSASAQPQDTPSSVASQPATPAAAESIAPSQPEASAAAPPPPEVEAATPTPSKTPSVPQSRAAASVPARAASTVAAKPAEPDPEPPAKPAETTPDPASTTQASQPQPQQQTDGGDARQPDDRRPRGYYGGGNRPYDRMGGGREGGGRFGRRGEMSASEEEVRRTMRAFQSAWDRLDVDTMRRIYPGFVPGGNQPYRNYTIEFDDMRVFVNGPRASVHAQVRYVLRSRLGASSRGDQFIYRLEQQNDGRWIMNGVQRVR